MFCAVCCAVLPDVDQHITQVPLEATWRKQLHSITGVSRCAGQQCSLPLYSINTSVAAVAVVAAAAAAAAVVLPVASCSATCCCFWMFQGFSALEAELAEAYDFVTPCFPPHYNIFDVIFQMYHVQFAQVRSAVSSTLSSWPAEQLPMSVCY
jgi:hypothetical protein